MDGETRESLLTWNQVRFLRFASWAFVFSLVVAHCSAAYALVASPGIYSIPVIGGTWSYWFIVVMTPELHGWMFPKYPSAASKAATETAPVEFEVYRADLLKMAESAMTIEEFVERWRGRKVKCRPPSERKSP